MINFGKILIAVAVTAVVLACGLSSTPALPADDLATVVASTLQALTPAAPAATETAPAAQATAQATAQAGIPVSYKNVSFTLPVGLASDAAPVSVAEVSGTDIAPWEASPEHIEFRLNNYNIAEKAFAVREIRIYPARGYADVQSAANIALQRVQGLLADPGAALTRQSMPRIPYFNADAAIAAQAARLHFQNGDGVRMVSQYGQAVMPVANASLFYQFVGLTSDGKYLVIAVLPVQAPVLQAIEDPSSPLPAGGVPFPATATDVSAYEAYYRAITDALNGTDSSAFTPSLAALDALVQSIRVQP
jgi:hypothetical protein